MAPRYRVRIKDQAGLTLVETTHFRRLEFKHEVDQPGYYSLELGADHPAANLFQTDGQVEVLRQDAEALLPWYTEFAGLHRKIDRKLTGDGDRVAISSGPGFLDLLEGRIIAWLQGTPQALKNGVAETVLKQLVNENAGPGATLAAGRARTGTRVGLTLQADGAGGPNWQGDLAYTSLLEALGKVANATGWRFDLVQTGAVAWEFRTYQGQRGADRTKVGLAPPTPTNGAGNVPVVFAPEMGTVRNVTYGFDRTAERTVAIMLGRGEGANRDVAVVTAAAATDSPWNDREVMRNASNQMDTAALALLGAGILEEQAAKETMDFSTIQIRGLLYGRDYTWGDKVVARFEGIEQDKEIIAVQITVDETGESILPTFADLPA
jgi:hypothetical protein